MSMRFARNAGFILILSAFVLGSAPVAGADEWGTGDSSTGAHPDADPHTFCYFSSVTEDMKSGIREAEWEALDPTQADVNFISSCNLSGSGETDVVWRQGSLSVDGSSFCEDFDGSNCDQYYVTLDAGNINVGSNDEIDESQTACHELGHTAGLSHGGTSDCMINASLSTPPTEVQFRRYNQHHRDHINAWF